MYLRSIALLLASLATLAVAGGCRRVSGPPRGVVLFSLDTLRADRLGAYGYAPATSPTLDRLAAEGVLFEQAFAPASWTVPSHASLLTALYPSSHGMTLPRHRLPKGVGTLAGLLSAHGFATAAVVNVGFLRRFERGFGSFQVVPLAVDETGAADEVNRYALDWLEAHRDERFFLFVHHYDAHGAYGARPEYRRGLVAPYEGPLDGSIEQLKQVRLGHRRLLPADTRHLSQLYDAGIRQLDASLGRFFEEARARGLLDDALVVVTSDHGEEFLEHGQVLHGHTLHPELTHVPLLFSGPGVPAGKRIREPVSLVDVLPTIAGQLGLPVPAGLDGVDLAAPGGVLGAEPARRPLFSEAEYWFHNPGRDAKHALRLGPYTLHYDARQQSYTLYDLRNDVQEQDDLARREPGLTAELRNDLEGYMQRPPRQQPAAPHPDASLEQLRRLGYLE